MLGQQALPSTPLPSTVTIYTDHNPLVYLQTMRNINQLRPPIDLHCKKKAEKAL